MNKKELKALEKLITELIETIVELSQTDTLKAFIYLQHQLCTSRAEVVGALPMVWSRRKDYQKEVELVGRGREKLITKMSKELNKLRHQKIEELYREFFP